MFDDRPKGVRHTADSVQLSLPFLSSLPYQAELFVEPAFSAVVDGSQLVLRGRSQPFTPAHTSTLDIDLQGLELAPLQSKSRELWVVRLRYAYADALEAAGAPSYLGFHLDRVNSLLANDRIGAVQAAPMSMASVQAARDSLELNNEFDPSRDQIGAFSGQSS